jgi:hypothetical protein
MNDFINPKSMMTPGAAGALVMFLSNAVCFQFPEIAPRWLALALSLILGALVAAAAKPKVLAATGYWLVNSLVIFAVAVGSVGGAVRGTNTTGSNAAAALNMLISGAYAQSAQSSAAAKGPATAATVASLQAQLEAANARLTAQQAQLAAAHQALASSRKEASAQPSQRADQTSQSKNSKQFFKAW